MKFFEKHEMLISILLIVIYIVTNSICTQNFGITDFRTTIINFVLSLAIVLFIAKNRLGSYYGLTKLPKAKEFLYFVPLILIVSVNLWSGININNSTSEIVAYIFSMICIGFLEEIIFRGFLFRMMEKDSVKRAIIVTSLTFGIGHIINLFNGAELVHTLMQVCYSISIGYLFAIIFIKGKSLWPCIITHAAVNALSVFNVENPVTKYLGPLFLVVVPVVYAWYIKKRVNR